MISERKQRLIDATQRVFYHQSFRNRAKILAPMPDYENYLAERDRIRLEGQKPSIAEELRVCWQEPLLSREQEQHVARQFNYWKYHARKKVESCHIARAEACLAEAIKCRNLIALANIRLAVNLNKKVYSSNSSEDLLSEAYSRVVRTVDYFDWRKGIKFNTYCTWAVRQHLWRTRKELQKPSEHEVVSEAILGASKDASHFKEIQQSLFKQSVNKLLCFLDERERGIIRHRFGIGCETLTLDELGEVYGVSKERIRQIEVRALKFMRELAQGQELEEVA